MCKYNLILGICLVVILNAACFGDSIGPIVFSSSTILNAGETYDTGVVANGLGTVLDIQGATIKNNLRINIGATANMTSGSIEGAIYMDGYPDGRHATFNMHGGTLPSTRLVLFENTIANMYGGNVDIDSFKSYSGASLNIYGYDFNINNTTGIVSGKLADHSSFTIDTSFYHAMPNLVTIPEPASLVILIAGVWFLRKRVL
jgi:hypothetical protein